MALQWTPLRRRGGSGGSTLVRARQNVETLEHQTQANVLLAFKLSMVSGNGISSKTNTLRPSYKPFRKMADVGVQVDDFPSYGEPPAEVNSTVAEINTFAEVNTSAEINTSADINTAAEINNSREIVEIDHNASVTSSNYYHRTISNESSTSSSGSESHERRRPLTNQDDVDAIFVQQSVQDEDLSAAVALNNNEKTEVDGFVLQEKEESNCGLDCVYFTMKCCECTII